MLKLWLVALYGLLCFNFMTIFFYRVLKNPTALDKVGAIFCAVSVTVALCYIVYDILKGGLK